MKKGTGYHLDMFLIGTFEIFCGLLGLPMLCAATGQWSLWSIIVLVEYLSDKAIVVLNRATHRTNYIYRPQTKLGEGNVFTRGGGMHDREGCTWRGGHVWQGGVRGRRDWHWSGRYASYWNAFFFTEHLFPFNTNITLLFFSSFSHTRFCINRVQQKRCARREA